MFFVLVAAAAAAVAKIRKSGRFLKLCYKLLSLLSWLNETFSDPGMSFFVVQMENFEFSEMNLYEIQEHVDKQYFSHHMI